MAAVGHGCHVFSERPLATTLEDLARLRGLAGRAGVEVVACLAMRTSPARLTVRRAVREGRIGRPICASAQESYPFASRDEFYKYRRTYGGPIPWVVNPRLGLHQFLHGPGLSPGGGLGLQPGPFQPSRHGGPGRPDRRAVRRRGGGVAVINFFDYLRPWGAFRRPWGDDRLRVAGTEGILETKDCGRAVELMTPDATESLPPEPERNLFAGFVAALRGEDDGLITIAESFRAAEVALKAREAQDRGGFVEL